MKVCFVERGNDILFQPITKQYIRSMSGMLKSATSVTEELLIERKRNLKREEKSYGLVQDRRVISFERSRGGCLLSMILLD